MKNKPSKGTVFLVIVLGIMLFRTFQILFFSSPIPADPDHYNYTINLDKTEITWISDPIDVGKMLAEQSEKQGNSIIGVAEWNARESECTIWAYEPKNRYDSEYMRTLGHEVLHCFRGSYHD